LSRSHPHLRAATAQSPEIVLWQRARDPSAIFYLEPAPPSSVRQWPRLAPNAPGTLDRRLAAVLGVDLRRCVYCGGATLANDSEGYLLITCMSGRCTASFGRARATLATWMQRQHSRHPGYRCSRTLYAVKHAVRLVQAGILPQADLTLDRRVLGTIGRGGVDGERLALAVHILRVFLGARYHACPTLTRQHGFTLTPGFVHCNLRTPDGARIGRKLATRLIDLLVAFGLIEDVLDEARQPLTVLSRRHHTIALYRTRAVGSHRKAVTIKHRKHKESPRESDAPSPGRALEGACFSVSLHGLGHSPAARSSRRSRRTEGALCFARGSPAQLGAFG
jgi:hypothetical protein